MDNDEKKREPVFVLIPAHFRINFDTCTRGGHFREDVPYPTTCHDGTPKELFQKSSSNTHRIHVSVLAFFYLRLPYKSKIVGKYTIHAWILWDI